MSQNTRSIKFPGPDHPIAITPHEGRVTVTDAGRRLAETHAALELAESTYPVVLYIPRKDADMSLFARSDHHSYCPYKGEASYFSLPLAGPAGENAVWSYETPHSAVAAIKDHLAFYPDRVTITKAP